MCLAFRCVSARAGLCEPSEPTTAPSAARRRPGCAWPIRPGGRCSRCSSPDGPETATNLAGGLPVTRQAVVKHLQVLADAGLLSSERAGREVRYRAEPQGMDDAVAWMVRSGAAWDRRLERLRRQLGP